MSTREGAGPHDFAEEVRICVAIMRSSYLKCGHQYNPLHKTWILGRAVHLDGRPLCSVDITEAAARTANGQGCWLMGHRIDGPRGPEDRK